MNAASLFVLIVDTLSIDASILSGSFDQYIACAECTIRCCTKNSFGCICNHKGRPHVLTLIVTKKFLHLKDWCDLTWACIPFVVVCQESDVTVAAMNNAGDNAYMSG